MTRTFRTKIDAYRFLNNCGNSDAAFIANVILNGCGKKAKRIKALATLVASGAEVSCASFLMPYVGFNVNGVYRPMEEVLG